LPGWSQTYAQLAPGRFAGSLELAEAHGGSVFRETINLAHIERLVIPETMVALAVPLSPGGLKIDGRHLPEGALMLTFPGAALEMSASPGHTLLAVCVDLAGLPPGERPATRTSHRPVGDADLARRTASTVEAMLAAARRRALPPAAGATLTDLTLAALAAGESGPPETPPSLERLGRVRDYVHANLEEALSVADLAAVAGVSTRALEAAFARHLGIGPKAYLQSVRLAAVRRALKRAATHGGTRAGTVTDVAYQYGFWHLSRFAERYRAMYGESPHRTLAGREPRA
jgi:AraC family ethanolamine operon transcriptional activator